MTSALIPYTPPPAVARALAARGYTSLQLEAHAAALARRARMRAVVAVQQHCKGVVAALPKPAAPRSSETTGYPPSAGWLVKATVGKDFGVSIADIEGQRRTNDVTIPRMIGIWIYKQLRPKTGSVLRIAEIFSSGEPRDHTTILHSLRKVADRMAVDEVYAERARRLLEECREKVGPEIDLAKDPKPQAEPIEVDGRLYSMTRSAISKRRAKAAAAIARKYGGGK
jgi:Bacterial dnaA protein helix-turn-helix